MLYFFFVGFIRLVFDFAALLPTAAHSELLACVFTAD